MANREAQRRYRERQRAKREVGLRLVEPVPVADPAEVLAEWSASVLVVPPGHPLVGQPMALPKYGVEFLGDALTHRESLLCLARKNGKSAIVAVLCLGLLAGPLARPGLRIGTVSVSREKSAELYRQMRDIAEASELEGLEFRKSPAPGWVKADNGSTAEFLSADKVSGHASGFDVVIVDELGLMGEADRELIAGMRSSTSARDGRFIALSIRGESPLLEEMIDRAGLPTCAVHLYAPEVGVGGELDIEDPGGVGGGESGVGRGHQASRVYGR